MRHAWLAACLVAVALSGCGGGSDDDGAGTTATTPVRISGERVLTGAGCLACHQIGERGSSGPGDSLAGIGARRSSAQIRRALQDHEPPVPAYGRLTPRNRNALVAYLASLRGDCPEGSDCG
jgi:mono/diheme cytochrome c family protein